MLEETAVSGVGRKVVPNRERLNREQSVTEALEFPSRTGKIFSLFFFSSLHTSHKTDITVVLLVCITTHKSGIIVMSLIAEQSTRVIL